MDCLDNKCCFCGEECHIFSQMCSGCKSSIFRYKTGQEELPTHLKYIYSNKLIIYNNILFTERSFRDYIQDNNTVFKLDRHVCYYTLEELIKISGAQIN